MTYCASLTGCSTLAAWHAALLHEWQSILPSTSAALPGRPVFACLVFLVLLEPKNRLFFVTGWTLELAQVHVTDPASRLPPETKIKVPAFAM